MQRGHPGAPLPGLLRAKSKATYRAVTGDWPRARTTSSASYRARPTQRASMIIICQEATVVMHSSPSPNSALARARPSETPRVKLV